MLKKSLLRFAIRLRLQVRGSPSVANPLSGTIPALRSPCFAVAPTQAVRDLGVRRDEGPPDLHFIIASPTGPLSWPASPVDLWLEEWYREVPVTEPMEAKRKTQFPVFSISQSLT